MQVAEPHKELRFTRSAQALPFWIGAAICFAAIITLLAVSQYREDNPELPHPLWALVPLLLAWVLMRIALHCTRHAYLILSPLGLEIFPLFRPEKNMSMIYWGEIDSYDKDERSLTIHFNAVKTSGVRLDLGPIGKSQRPLLEKALQGRLGSKQSQQG